ncbi:MAG: 1-deoxy-D-xylulose-5-phosphate reductoisomerase [Hirschia sp.]|nr:1-deoxy-D-xylulose-5-phosphate reductoisomerase [Hirschia sp.]MBF18028.1 1-deoxy-D-xylulose-5-phosphate reductoisomerase [Hirschia sp.]
MNDPKRISVLGATGSIGDSTLSILTEEGANDRFKVVALTANSNVKKLAEAAIRTQAELAVIADETLFDDLKRALQGTATEVAAGQQAIDEAAAIPADTIVSAIMGAAALAPTLQAVRQGANVALANKESLVCAGELLLKESETHGATLLPVDSEHNAIFQVLDRRERVEKLILTASGGPFRTLDIEDMIYVSPDQALAHPNWTMGAKISIDSATMMNKGLELIEAAYLFRMDERNIDVLIHPQSIIHSMVCYDDGSVLAQLGMPDMKTPISYAIAWPHRMPVPGVERLDLAKLATLSFEAHDPVRFPAINLARDAFRAGGVVPCVMNAANEIAVESFLRREIGFLSIVELNRQVMDAFMSQSGASNAPSSFEDVFEIDRAARQVASDLLKTHAA